VEGVKRPLKRQLSLQYSEKQALKAHMLSRNDALKTDIRSYEALAQPVAPDPETDRCVGCAARINR